MTMYIRTDRTDTGNDGSSQEHLFLTKTAKYQAEIFILSKKACLTGVRVTRKRITQEHPRTILQIRHTTLYMVYEYTLGG